MWATLAGFFVLLALTYAEVSARFPGGARVVTVAAQAINAWIGAFYVLLFKKGGYFSTSS